MRDNMIIKGELKPENPLLIMVHGRGASARDIISLADHLSVDDFTLIAPQATNNTWYPYSFLAPQSQNQPALGKALGQLEEIIKMAEKAGLASEKTFFLGFSQGACLALEFVARNTKRYGGVIAFTGGLIGDEIVEENYKGSFEGTEIYIGTSDPDPHVPVARVKETEIVLNTMGAKASVDIFPNMGHTIIQEEINNAIRILKVH